MRPIVTCEGPGTVTLVDVPQFELRVSGGGHDVFTVEKLDVGHGFTVTLEHVERRLGGSEVVIVNTVVSRPEGEMVTGVWIELDTADVRLGLQTGHRVRHVGGPELHSRVVAAGGDEFGVHQVEVHRPAALLVLVPHGGLLVGGAVPDYHGALVVAAGEHGFVEAAPRDAGDLARTDHLCGGIVNIDHVLQDHIIVIDLDFLSHAGDCKKLLVLVKLNTGDNRAVVEHVRGVGQSCEGPDCVVPRQTGQTAPKLLQTSGVLLGPAWLRLLDLAGEEELFNPGVGVAGDEVPPVVVHPLSPPRQGALLSTQHGLISQQVEAASVEV